MCNVDDFKILADMIEHIPLLLRPRYVFCCAPIPKKQAIVCSFFLTVGTPDIRAQGGATLHVNIPMTSPALGDCIVSYCPPFNILMTDYHCFLVAFSGCLSVPPVYCLTCYIVSFNTWLGSFFDPLSLDCTSFKCDVLSYHGVIRIITFVHSFILTRVQ